VQNITNPATRSAWPRPSCQGHSAVDALAQLKREEPFIDFRQISIIDREGRAATHSGNRTLGTHSAWQLTTFVCARNTCLKSQQVNRCDDEKTGRRPEQEHIGDRVLAGQGWQGSPPAARRVPCIQAGMLIVDRTSWPLTDLRVDWHETEVPSANLKRIWELWRPQMDAYVTRALNPARRPLPLGVPGNQLKAKALPGPKTGPDAMKTDQSQMKRPRYMGYRRLCERHSSMTCPSIDIAP